MPDQKLYTIRAHTGAMKDLTERDVYALIPDLSSRDKHTIRQLQVGARVQFDERLAVERAA